MIKVGMELGLSHLETLKLSRKIDTLQNKLNRMNVRKSTK